MTSFSTFLIRPKSLKLSKVRIIKSSLKDTEFKVERGLTCNQGGIYLFEGVCRSQYTGKTVSFGNRSIDHFRRGKMSSIKDHMKECRGCNSVKDFSVTFVENYLSRGKYSLSEREMLWNERIKGQINVQKTLQSS